MDLFYDLDSGKFDQKKYENEYPNLREFYECFERFKSKVYIKEITYSDFERNINILDSDDELDIFLPDSDSDSDSDGVDSDDLEVILSDSDSD